MSANKWTPGPWAVETHGPDHIEIVDEETLAITICTVRKRAHESVMKANAALIAEAPALYFHLERIVGHLSDRRTTQAERDSAVLSARAALAKARGES